MHGWLSNEYLQYIPRNMHTVFICCALLWLYKKKWLIFPYPSGLLHWHCGNLTIAPVPAKQPWWIWINTSCEFIMNDCITTTKQSTTKPRAYFLGYTCTVFHAPWSLFLILIFSQTYCFIVLTNHVNVGMAKWYTKHNKLNNNNNPNLDLLFPNFITINVLDFFDTCLYV